VTRPQNLVVQFCPSGRRARFLNARETFDDLFIQLDARESAACDHAAMSISAVFANSKEQREIAAGETVFAEGDSGREMLGMISGAIELRKGDRTVRVLEPGDTFGEMSIVSDAPRSLTAVATQPAVLAVIDERAFLFLVHETPMFAIQVMRSMAELIRELDALG
jgi:CRP/FNR family transcriptional regulator, cyclic AMP receptor protein